MEKNNRQSDSQISSSQVKDKEWYILFVKSGIPIIGFIYLIYMAFNSRNPNMKSYAGAMVKYRLTTYVIAAILLGMGVLIAIPYMQKLLDYIELL